MEPKKWILTLLLVASVKANPQFGEQGDAKISDSGGALPPGPPSPPSLQSYFMDAEDMVEIILATEPDDYPDPPEDDEGYEYDSREELKTVRYYKNESLF